MNHRLYRLIAAILLIGGAVSFLAGVQLIHNNVISDNQALRLMCLSMGIPVILLSFITILRPSLADSHRHLWYIISCGILFIIPNIVLAISWNSSSGFDCNVYCSAISAYDQGFDPYNAEYNAMYTRLPNPYATLPFPYPPIFLYLFKLPCLGNFRITYPILWGILLIASLLVVSKGDRKADHSLSILLLTTGFAATTMNFLGGNIGLLNLFLLVLVFAFITRMKFYLAALVLGLIASIKIWPLALVILFLFIPATKSTRFKACFLAFTTFAAIHLISYILFPDITPSYYEVVSGTSSHHTPIQETTEGSLTNPSMILAVKTLSYRIFGQSIIPLILMMIIYSCFIIYGYIRHIIYVRDSNYLIKISLAIIAMLLLMPRLQYYSFVFALPPLYYLMKHNSPKEKFTVLFIVSAFPIIFLLTFMMVTYDSTSIIDMLVSPTYADDPGLSLLTRFAIYGQGISLLVFYIYYLVKENPPGILLFLAKKAYFMKSSLLNKRNLVSD